MTLIIIIAIIVLILWHRNSNQEPKKAPLKKITRPTINNCTTRRYNIAGINHYCRSKDIGVIYGYVVPEPDNRYDKNALQILHDNGKSLGYIRRIDQDDYLNFANGANLPFVGYIDTWENEEGRLQLYGKIRVYIGEPDEVAESMIEDKNYLMDIFQIVDHDMREDELHYF